MYVSLPGTQPLSLKIKRVLFIFYKSVKINGSVGPNKYF